MTSHPLADRWASGQVVRRREVLGLQPDAVAAKTAVEGVWLEVGVHIVADDEDGLVSYIAPGAVFTCPEGPWPTADGRHPWSGRGAWEGHGVLMVQRPGEHHAIWHFWHGPERSFDFWYINLQTAFVRRPDGYDTQDLELDIIVRPDGSYVIKDEELLDERVAAGRYSPELVAWIRDYGRQIVRRLETEGPWWDRRWADWTPGPGFEA